MPGAARFRRPQRPQRDPNDEGAFTWERFDSGEQQDYVARLDGLAGVTGRLEENELCIGVSLSNSWGLTFGTAVVTPLGVLTVPVTAGTSGRCIAKVTTWRPPRTVNEAITVANDLKAVYEAHRQDTNADHHGNEPLANIIASPDATTWASLVTLVNELVGAGAVGDIYGHQINASAHTPIDDINLITETAIPSTMAEMQTKIIDGVKNYMLHIRDLTGGFHYNAPDSSNIVASSRSRVIPVHMKWNYSGLGTRPDPYG